MRERENEGDSEGEREGVRERERERECAFVCVRERERERVISQSSLVFLSSYLMAVGWIDLKTEGYSYR